VNKTSRRLYTGGDEKHPRRLGKVLTKSPSRMSRRAYRY